RLLKAWNAKVGYPIASFQLEQEIVNINYYGCNTLEDYFFRATESLSTWRSGNASATQKIESLKSNISYVTYYLDINDLNGALAWLKHILPF
ncbi:MAG: nucleotidyltransferase, partial [Ignavibacteria bacterium]